jgi:hypothetical protein
MIKISKTKKIIWIFLAIFTLYFITVYELQNKRRYKYVSPYKSIEKAAWCFDGSLGSYHAHDININAYYKYFTELFKLKGYNIPGENGFLYKNEFYKEEFIFYLNYVSEQNIFYPRNELFELVFFANMELEDIIVDYWLEPFYLNENDYMMTVSYRYKSGAVVQIGDIYEIEGKPKEGEKEHNYMVVRMYFADTKFKSLFPKAYFITDMEIQQLKEKWGLKLEKYYKENRDSYQ